MGRLKVTGIVILIILALSGIIFLQYQVNMRLVSQVASLSETLEQVKASQEASAKSIKELAATTQRLDRSQAALSRKAKELERTDEEVKAYLTQPVPAAVARLLNEARKAGRGAADPVP